MAANRTVSTLRGAIGREQQIEIGARIERLGGRRQGLGQHQGEDHRQGDIGDHRTQGHHRNLDPAHRQTDGHAGDEHAQEQQAEDP
jgi:hypothetical protein